MKYALELQAVKGRDEKTVAFRAIIHESDDGLEPVCVSDIVEMGVEEGETPLQALLNLQGYWYEWDAAKKVTGVWMGWGVPFEYPDCLSVWEAAEARASFPRDLFDRDPLGIK